jgi:hypothetical protein
MLVCYFHFYEMYDKLIIRVSDFIIYIFYFFNFCTMSNLMPNFIPKILTVEFLVNCKLAEFEHEREPGD